MKVYLLAGEASGDQLGAALISGLLTFHPEASFCGVGGPEMERVGLNSLFPMSDLSVMGLTEIIPRYLALRRRLHEAVEDIIAKKPDILITIDSPDFSFRLARLVRRQIDIPVAHYVAPSVWAWRSGRAKKMADYVDHVLAILPFEPPYMRAVGMSCDFVGHPIAALPVPTNSDVSAFRQSVGLESDQYLLALPGSRQSEVIRHLPVFRKSIEHVLKTHPDIRIVVPTTAHLESKVTELMVDWPGNPIVLGPKHTSGLAKLACFRGAVVALAASGTVSLELASTGTPTVIAYRTSWLNWQIMSRLVKVDSVTLVNLVTQTRTIPEFLGPKCLPEPISASIEDLIVDETARATQKGAMNDTMRALGRGGEAPGLRAARSVLRFLSKHRVDLQ